MKQRLANRNMTFIIRKIDLRTETDCLLYETTTYGPKRTVCYTKRRLTVRNGPFAIRNDDLRSETNRLLYETTTYDSKRTVCYTE